MFGSWRVSPDWRHELFIDGRVVLMNRRREFNPLLSESVQEGGFGRKKKAEAPKEEKQETASTSAPSGDAPATLMEMTTEMSGFSSAPVELSRFAVPSGFKKVESDMQRRQR